MERMQYGIYLTVDADRSVSNTHLKYKVPWYQWTWNWQLQAKSETTEFS
jgi:hypothetical protein